MRHAAVLLVAVLGVLPLAPPAGAGGEPASIPTDWVKVTPGPGAEIVRFVQQLPHDPNLLGVLPAHLRTKPYAVPFGPTRFPSLDGTPLAGSLGVHVDSKPRPGVVLVPGLTQTTTLKYLVELADLFVRNGWHVLTIDVRGQGESRALSGAPISFGWKETEDVLGAVRHLRDVSKATSVSVIGFSNGGRSLVKAMARDRGQTIAAGVAVTAPLAAPSPAVPPPPGYTPNPVEKFFLDALGTGSYYEYYERAARFYAVDIPTLQAQGKADTEVSEVKAPLLLLYGTDDTLQIAQVQAGRHDGGIFSLAYRDTVRDHPFVRTLLIRRGGHSGGLYLQDPHWFGLAVLNYLKHWQARDAEHVTTAVPPLDVLAEATLGGKTATYRFLVRNHGTKGVGPLGIHLDLPDGVLVETCWLGGEGLGRCAKDQSRLTWTLPRLSGGKATAGPFVAVVDVSRLKPGRFEAQAWVDHPGLLRQELPLEKK
jgi:alpha-beta hydrolase superfamily lysophospholipase